MTGWSSWELARASGVTSYLLLVALVATGLVLSHPWATRLRRPRPATRLAWHASLAVFTLAFTLLHAVVLATDQWAQVGWRGAILPMASTYRPVPVTLGVLAVWAGLLTGFTAALAGRLAVRLWWPLHKAAAGIFVLVWAHSVLAGTDTAGLRWLYLGSGLGLAVLAVSRYTARTAADRVGELVTEVAAKATVEPRRGDRR